MNFKKIMMILVSCMLMFLTACNEAGKVNSVSITSGDKKIYIGDTTSFDLNIDSQDGKYKNITWYSTDKSVATVDADGVVTGISKGTAIIKVSVDGNIDQANVKVRVPVARGTLYSIEGGENCSYSSANNSPMTALTDYEGYANVLKVESGRDWGGGPFAYVVFSDFPDFTNEFNALEFVVKTDKTTMTGKVQNASGNLEKVVTLEANTDISKGYLVDSLGNGWYKVTVPFTQTSLNQVLLFGGWMVQQTLYLTDIKLVKI